MKMKRVMAIPISILGIMLLGGCGAEPYVLTEQEESVIVNYSASVVSKFNTFQKDGLTYVIAEETETLEEPLEEPKNEPVTEDANDAEIDVGGQNTSDIGTDEADSSAWQQAVMNDVFGKEGLNVEYAGNQISDSYVEGDVYSLVAPAGKTYLVLNFTLANETEADIELDNMTNGSTFKASFTGADGTNAEANAYSTILLNDFSTYMDTIPAGEAKEAVLLFEVPENVTSVETLKLFVELNEKKYEINL